MASDTGRGVEDEKADEEVRRVLQLLSRRTKDNPVPSGAPGVGKTAIVEALTRNLPPVPGGPMRSEYSELACLFLPPFPS